MSDHSGAPGRGEEKLAADSATVASDRVSDEAAAIDIGEPGVLGIVEEKDVDVPMRDGVVLRANELWPKRPKRPRGASNVLRARRTRLR